jgi:hypothetical protein
MPVKVIQVEQPRTEDGPREILLFISGECLAPHAQEIAPKKRLR